MTQSQANMTVPQRLEHIEALGKEARDTIQKVLESLGTLTERSAAHSQALADLRSEVRTLSHQQNTHSQELARIPSMERDVASLFELHRAVNERLGKIEQQEARSGVIHAAATKLAGHAVSLIFGLILAGLIWLASLRDLLPPGGH